METEDNGQQVIESSTRGSMCVAPIDASEECVGECTEATNACAIKDCYCIEVGMRQK